MRCIVPSEYSASVSQCVITNLLCFALVACSLVAKHPTSRHTRDSAQVPEPTPSFHFSLLHMRAPGTNGSSCTIEFLINWLTASSRLRIISVMTAEGSQPSSGSGSRAVGLAEGSQPSAGSGSTTAAASHPPEAGQQRVQQQPTAMQALSSKSWQHGMCRPVKCQVLRRLGATLR